NSATIKATVQNSSLTDARGDIFQFDLTNNAVGDLVFKGNTVNNTHPNIVTGGGGLTLSGGGLAASNVTFTYDIGGPKIADINATITNNTITEFNSNAASRNGIHVNLGTTGGDTTFMCVDVQNDSAATAGSTDSGLGSDYLLRQRQATTMRLPGYGGVSGVP